MTAQEVIKSFMNQLANHGYAGSDSVGSNMLDSAIRASSRFGGIQDVIDDMKTAQVAAEKEAVEEVLGSEFADKTMSEISSDILRADAKNYDPENKSNAYYDQSNDERSTVENFIKERKADIFLRKYCGIILPKECWFNSEGAVADWGELTGNDDTGAITGLDAGGSSVAKTAHSVLPEIFVNAYIASTSESQNILTNDRDWVVQATDADDTIISNGADSINAGAGNDQIIANASGATVKSGDGEDLITISEGVTDITLSDLNSYDTLTIRGEFEIGSAQIEDSLLVVTDRTGTRKIRLGDFETSTSAKVNSTTISEWLKSAGISLNNLKTTNYSDGKVLENSSIVEEGRVEIDSNYTLSSITLEKNFVDEGISKSLVEAPDNVLNDVTDSFITVDLSTVDTSEIGEVTINGVAVGSLSSTYPNATTFTRNGLTIHLLGVTSTTSGNTSRIEAKTLDELTDEQRTIIAGLFKWWVGASLKLSEESYGIGFNSSTAAVKDMGLFFYDSQGNGNTLAAAPYWPRDADGATTQLMLKINMHYYTDIAADNVDGTSPNASGFLDRTLAHELTHSNMETNINYFEKLPQFIVEGTAELVHGIDDERCQRIFNVAADSSKLNTVLDVTNTSTGDSDFYAGGYMFLRYFAKQAAAQTESLPAFGEITANVELSEDGGYYIAGNSTSETALTTAQTIKLGAVSAGVYTVENTGIHQVITNTNNLKIAGLTINDTMIGGNSANIVETSEGSFIVTGGGADSIKINGQYSTIDVGDGNDKVSAENGGHHFVNLGDGDNFVEFKQVRTYDNTVASGADNDTISFDYSSYNGSITTGAGDDSIYFGGNNNTILTGKGNDILRFHYSNDSENFIDFGEGDDRAVIFGGNNTIIGGRGNDSLYINSSLGNCFAFNAAFGEDTIYGFKTSDTILIPDSFDYAQEGSLLTITGKATGRIKGTVNLNIFNDTVNVVVGAIREDESIYVIENFDNDTLVAGTAEDDTIENTGSSVTIKGSTGDDEIFNIGENVVINYSEGDGNDVIAGFNATSTLIIGGGSGTYSTIESDSDIVVTSGKGTITLRDAASLSTINIQGIEINPFLITLTEENNSVEVHGTKMTVQASESNDKILLAEDATSLTLENFASGDEIQLSTTIDNLETISGGIVAGTVTISGLSHLSTTSKEWSINDNIATHVMEISEGATLLEDKKTIIYNEAEKESVTIGSVLSTEGLAIDTDKKIITVGASALNQSLVTIGEEYTLTLASDVAQSTTRPKEWSLDGTTAIYKNDSTIEGYTLENNQITYSSASGGETLLELTGIASAPTVTGSTVKLARKNFASNVSVVNGGDYNFEFNKTFYASKTFSGSEDSESIVSNGTYLKISGGAGDDNIKGGMKNTLNGGDGNDTLTGSKSNDYLNGGAGNDTLTGGAGNDTFAYSSGADVITDYVSNDRISIEGSLSRENFAIEGSDVILSYGENDSLTIKDGLNKNINFLEGRKITTDVYIPEGVLDKNKKRVTLTSAAESFNATKYSKLVTIDASAVNSVDIVGNAKANKIYASSLNSTINGGKGNDTLYGGEGADIFVYEKNSGKDIIQNYGEGDIVSLGSGASFKEFFMKNNDAIVKISTGSMTIKNTSEFTYVKDGSTKIFSNGNVFDADRISVTLSTAFSGRFELGDYRAADASYAKRYVILDGNSENNSLIGGKGTDILNGGAGDDTLWGGKSNDTLYGGEGNDMFIFQAGEGIDTIMDYQRGDSLQILKKDGTEGTFNNEIFQNKTLTLSIVGGGKVIFKGVDSTSEFNINNTTYHVDGRHLIE